MQSCLIKTGWKPTLRNVTYQERPEWVPEWVYTMAMTAKYNYNAEWEFWVYRISVDFNCSVAKAEDACIRGIQKEICRFKHTYGDKIGSWFEQFLDMRDIFSKVQHPEYRLTQAQKEQ